MEQFLRLYEQLDPETLDYLETMSIPSHRNPRPAPWLPERLLDCAPVQVGQLSWLGRKVVNWRRQLREASQRKLRPSRPLSEENGDSVGPPCPQFRELLFSGVYCWCGRLRSCHPLEVVRTASRMLAYQERNRRLGPLASRATGRSFVELARKVPSELRHLLQQIGADGTTLSDLSHKLRGLSFVPAIQLGLDYLADLDLAYPDQEGEIWYASWEGMGLRTWLQEQFVHTALHETLPEVRPGENGHTLLPVACERFRPLLSHGGGFCWCGHPFRAHSQGEKIPGC